MKQVRIVEMVGGRPRTRLVGEDELKRLNTPVCTKRKCAYDAEVERYGTNFDVRNTVFGNE